MGGCVSSPKDLELNEGEQAPIESPNSPKNVEGETLAHETKEVGEKEESEKKEEPLVELSGNKEEKVDAASEAKEEAKVEEPKAEDKKDEPLVTL